MDTEIINEDKKKRLSKKVLVIVLILFVAIFCLAVYLAFYYSGQPKDKDSSTPPPILHPAKIELSLYAKDLPNTTAIASPPSSKEKRLFVADREGHIKIVTKDQKVGPEPFLDISDKVLAKDEMGLLGLTFSPDYSKDGNFFVNYIDKSQNTVIAKYHVSSDSHKADTNSAQTLLTLAQPYPNHNGGALVFGPDGYLYVALGDGGGAGDPQNRAQNLSSLLGKILRLDVKQVPYTIPPDNPFVDQADAAPEVWDYGLRNPWRISFDRKSHELYIADVGQNATEEINVEPKARGGNNYGWRCYESTKDYELQGCAAREKYTFPALEYDHNDGRCSITGGYVYRGKQYSQLEGKYFYGDFCNGELYFAQKQKGQWASTLAVKSPYQISTFGEDSAGEIYLADFASGNIYQIIDSANPVR